MPRQTARRVAFVAAAMLPSLLVAEYFHLTRSRVRSGSEADADASRASGIPNKVGRVRAGGLTSPFVGVHVILPITAIPEKSGRVQG